MRPFSHARKFCRQHTSLKVICPSTPADAKGMLKAAIRDNDPVCVMENTILYNLKGDVPEDEDFLIPLGKARTVCEGNDLSIIAHGRSVQVALQVAETLSEKHGVSVEVLPRSIRPLDLDAILETVRKTNRVLSGRK